LLPVLRESVHGRDNAAQPEVQLSAYDAALADAARSVGQQMERGIDR
jgi:hypothetical protein